MKKIDPETRVKIFTQYLYLYCNSSAGFCFLCDVDFIKSLEWIELKPLAHIFDSEEECAAALSAHSGLKSSGHWTQNDDILISELVEDILKRRPVAVADAAINFLRSRSYALPYGQYSVEDLVAEGIYKLKTEN